MRVSPLRVRKGANASVEMTGLLRYSDWKLLRNWKLLRDWKPLLNCKAAPKLLQDAVGWALLRAQVGAVAALDYAGISRQL
jgi:hypothetical protein